VRYVPAGTPASSAGVMPGDLIIKINRKPVEEISDTELSELMFGEPGSKMKLKVLRNGKKKRLKLRLEDYI